MTRDATSATELIENLAESSSDRCVEYDRKRGSNVVDTQKMDEINTKLTQINDLLKSQQQRGVHAVEPEDQRNFGTEEVSYVTGHDAKQGYTSNFRHPNLSYRSTNVENPQDQVYPPLDNQGYGSNSNFRSSYQGQGSSSQGQGQGQQGYSKPSSYQTPYQPPPFRNYSAAKPPQYPQPQPSKDTSQDEIKGMLQLLITNSQKVDGRVDVLATKLDALTTHVKTMDTQLAQQAEAIRRQPGTLPGRPEGNPRVEHVNAITLISGAQLLSSKQAPTKPSKVGDLATFEELPAWVNFANSETSGDQHHDAPTPVYPERVYIPKVPYPLHLYKPRVAAATKETLMVVPTECAHIVEDMDPSKIIDEKEPITTKEEECALITEEGNVMLPNEMPPKLDDPGTYSIPIKIGSTDFPTSLCDLGSSVNLMPHLTAKRLGFNKLERTNISLMFADRSLRAPLGILTDVLVHIGHAVVPVDFVVLEIEDEPPEPLILGRPFLRTAGANIDVRNGIIELNIGPNVLHFQVDDLLGGRPPYALDPNAPHTPILVAVPPIVEILEPPWRAECKGQADSKVEGGDTVLLHDPPPLK